MQNLTLRQLDYALAIARHGSLTAAALALHVSQPALSTALSQLETALGRALFLRRPGGPILPTAFGTAWLAEAGRHRAGLARLMTGQVASPLRLGLFEDLAPAVLAPLLAFAATEGLALEPQAMGFAALARALERGEIDAALSWALGLPPGPRVEVAAIRPQAVVPPDHALAGRSATLAEIADHSLVLTDQDLSIAHVQALFHARGLTARIAHRCASLDLMRSFAANGLGVGLSWTQPAPRHSHDGKPFVLVPIDDAPAEPVVLALGSARPDVAQITRLLRDVLEPIHDDDLKAL